MSILHFNGFLIFNRFILKPPKTVCEMTGAVFFNAGCNEQVLFPKQWRI